MKKAIYCIFLMIKEAWVDDFLIFVKNKTNID